MNIELVVKMYADGKSVYSIAEEIGASKDTVWRALKVASVKMRRPGQLGHKYGPEHVHWKGSAACYTAFHHRLDTRYGKPSTCEVCLTSDAEKTYEWANLSGRYEDIEDYKRMCRSCHRKYDNARRRGSEG